MRTNLTRWTLVAGAAALALGIAQPVLSQEEEPVSELVPRILSSGPLTSAPGAKVEIEIKVQNKGSGDSTGTDALLLKSDDATITPDDATVDKARVKPLSGKMGDSIFAAYESWDHTFELQAPDAPGTHFYGICIEPGRKEKTEPKCSDPIELKVAPAQ